MKKEKLGTKVLSLVLSVLMLITLVPTNVYATTTGDVPIPPFVEGTNTRYKSGETFALKALKIGDRIEAGALCDDSGFAGGTMLNFDSYELFLTNGQDMTSGPFAVIMVFSEAVKSQYKSDNGDYNGGAGYVSTRTEWVVYNVDEPSNPYLVSPDRMVTTEYDVTVAKNGLTGATAQFEIVLNSTNKPCVGDSFKVADYDVLKVTITPDGSNAFKTPPTVTATNTTTVGTVTKVADSESYTCEIVGFTGNSTITVNGTASSAGGQTDDDKLAEAKPLAEKAITDITATNDTTAGNILDAVTAGISSVSGVTASWKSGSPIITPATKDKAGSITGTIVLTSGSKTVEVNVNKVINKLPVTDDDKLAEAKPLAEKAITDIPATNDTTAGNILDAVTTGISFVNGVTASWKSDSPIITPATKDKAGSITGTIVLTSGSKTVEVTVNKVINKLPVTDDDKLTEAKPLAEKAITDITATNDTTAGNILNAVTTGISSVSGVTASWKSGSPIITPATKDKAGSITGTIVLTSGSKTVEVNVNKVINKLPVTDDDKLAEAKPLAEKAITDITATNDTTAGNILNAVTAGISSVDGVKVSWETGSPIITKAISDKAGSITGTIVLTSGSKTVEISVNKVINKLTSKDIIVDKTTGTEIEYEDGSSFADDITLVVAPKSKDEMKEFQNNVNKVVTGKTIAGVYDIKLLKNGVEIQPDGKLKISLALTNEMKAMSDLQVVYIDDNGKVTIIPSQLIDGKLVFVTDHFSYYGVIGKEKSTGQIQPETPSKPSSPQTGDTSNTMLYFGLIILSGCIAGYGFKKKKALRK